MLPLLHTGNLAVVHTRESYGVGDAVLYNSPVLHRPVLHRVLAVHDGQYSLRGDNNDFTDPGTVPASAIIGKLWFHLPRVGGWVGWLTKPFHAALVAVGAVLILLLGGQAKRGRRARRRGHAARPEPPTVDPAGPTSRGATVQPVTPRDFVLKGVNLPRALRPLTAVLAFGLLLAVIGFAVPSHREAAAPGAFRQLGDFSYVSKLTAPNAAYPTGLAQTGDPLLLDLFHDVDLRFNYQFNTGAAAQDQGHDRPQHGDHGLDVLPPDVRTDQGSRLRGRHGGYRRHRRPGRLAGVLRPAVGRLRRGRLRLPGRPAGHRQDRGRGQRQADHGDVHAGPALQLQPPADQAHRARVDGGGRRLHGADQRTGLGPQPRAVRKRHAPRCQHRHPAAVPLRRRARCASSASCWRRWRSRP